MECGRGIFAYAVRLICCSLDAAAAIEWKFFRPAAD